jgi:hypothetical protein
MKTLNPSISAIMKGGEEHDYGSRTVDRGKSEVFFEIPLNMIFVEEQIRTGINLEGESFLALKASIAEKGVLEPVLVTPRDGKYLLISGERRFLACQELALERVPCRVLNAVEARAAPISRPIWRNSATT